jgi:hypothetical protein
MFKKPMSPAARIRDQIKRYYNRIQDSLQAFDEGLRDKFVNHENNLMKAFEVYSASIAEERNYYKKKLKEQKRVFNESVKIKELHGVIEELRDELMRTRATNERMYKENVFIKNELRH